MLKHLKKTWRTRVQDSDGNSLSPESSTSNNVPLPSTSRKRSRSRDNGDSGSERPPKYMKAGKNDSIRNHLPEILDDASASWNKVANMSELRASVLEMAKRVNTIAYLPKLTNIDTLCYDFLGWTAKMAQDEEPAVNRVVVFIVDKEASVDAHTLYIRNSLPQYSCDGYTSNSLKSRVVDFFKYNVIVITSQALLEALSRGLLQMPQIQALVIEDAQQIRSHDCYSFLPIVQLMNAFYSPCHIDARPRVFAVALCPDLSQHPFDSRSLKLEATLHSLTYGITQERREQIINLPDRPNETVVLYDCDTVDLVAPTGLSSQLQSLDPGMTILRKQFREAKHIATEIGTCASDLVFRRALKDLERGLPSWTGTAENDDADLSTITKLKLRDTIKNWAYNMPNSNPSSRNFNVSHKLLRLIQVLEACADYGEDFRGMVFVQSKSTATALGETIKSLPERLKYISPLVVSGKMRFQAQQQAFSNFASGFCNLLIVTKSVPELDIPKASVVIRFDLLDSQLLYGQVRACTRGRESHMVHLVERHNDHQRRILSSSLSGAEELSDWMDKLRDSETILVPPTNLTESQEAYHSDSDEEGTEPGYITESTLGGRVYPRDAVATLLKFASSLRELGHIQAYHPLFNFQYITTKPGRPAQFICKISLPNSPVEGISSIPEPSKQMARRSAAFSACKLISDMGILDYTMVPLPPTVPLKEPADIQNETGSRQYARKHPAFWTNGNTGPVTSLYPTVVHISGPNAVYSPLLVFTRKPFPPLPSFDLFSSASRVTIRFHRASPFSPDEEEMNTLHGFTLRLHKLIVNKPAACPTDEMTYFFGALTKSWRLDDPNKFGPLPDLVDDIDWELMSRASEKWAEPIEVPITLEMEEELADAVVQDRWLEFTRRYFVTKVRHDLNPLSKPADSKREADYDSLLAYVAERRKANFTGLKDMSQPIIEVEKVPSLSNNLNPRSRELPDGDRQAKYLIPELCGKCTIPASLFRTLLLTPSLFWKVDDLLVVKELNMRLFNNTIREDELYMAITTVSAEMEHNYERLELLGDAFLKYLASVVVFVTNPSHNEGSLHVARQVLISNKTLHACSNRVGLTDYIRSKLFQVKAWRPWPSVTYYQCRKETSADGDDDGDEKGEGEGTVGAPPMNHEQPSLHNPKKRPSPAIPPPPPNPTQHPEPTEDDVPGITVGKRKRMRRGGKKHKRLPVEGFSDLQFLGDKAIADVAEAVIGAAYVSGGRESALGVAKSLALPMRGINTWADFSAKLVISYATDLDPLPPGSIEAVEAIIGHRFRRPHLISQVLAHSSAKGNKVLTYERLEFLGDAILDFMVIRYIYDRERTLSPGGLTLLKSAMVSNSTLGAICVTAGIHQHLHFASPQLSASIQEYAKLILKKAEDEYALAESEGRPAGQFWADTEPPKALSDVVESIIGALYISAGFSPIGAEAFFDKVLQPFFDKHVTLQTLTHHPTKTLFEFIQAHGCQQLKLKKGSKVKQGFSLCEILIHDTVFASASDTSIGGAARKASTAALARVKQDGLFLFNLCDCRTGSQSKSALLSKGFEHALSSLEAEGDYNDGHIVATVGD